MMTSSARTYETVGFAHSNAVASRGRDAVERAARGESQRFDIELMVAGGRLITVDFSLEPVKDPDGTITCLVASCHDVTERVEAHAELRQKAAQDLARSESRVSARWRAASPTT